MKNVLLLQQPAGATAPQDREKEATLIEVNFTDSLSCLFLQITTTTPNVEISIAIIIARPSSMHGRSC